IAPGADADIVIYDPAAEQVISAETHHMNVDYSAYEGKRITGRVETVFSRGEPVIENRTYVGRAGHGRYTPRGTCQYLA
ncbi:dihydropyrimidinase, partial [Streptomyces sp. MI02-7b]|nr:dihydropyrimidinase [Streptomyces sp. MI02-7b]